MFVTLSMSDKQSSVCVIFESIPFIMIVDFLIYNRVDLFWLLSFCYIITTLQYFVPLLYGSWPCDKIVWPLLLWMFTSVTKFIFLCPSLPCPLGMCLDRIISINRYVTNGKVNFLSLKLNQTLSWVILASHYITER